MSYKTGNSALIEQFLIDGIKYMFGNPGTVEEGFLDALENYPDFQYINTLQESIAVGIADGYARKSGRPTVIQLHSGVGLGNGIGMIYQANRGHSPLLIVAGHAGVEYDAFDAQMAVDLVSIAAPVTKYSARVLHKDSMLRLIRRGLKMCAAPPAGPVFVSLPLDVMDVESTEEIVPTSHLDSRAAPDIEAIERIARGLAGATNPLIIIGDGVGVSDAVGELTKVAELLGATVYSADNSTVNIAWSHPLYNGMLGHMFGSHSRQIVSEADSVLIVGTYLLPEVFPSITNIFKKGAKVYHIDLNSYEIAKNHPVELGIVADPKRSLAMLGEALERFSTTASKLLRMTRIDEAAERKKAALDKEKANDKKSFGRSPLTMAEFSDALSKRIPDDTIIFDEALTVSPDITRYIPPDRPGQYFLTRGGSLGVGIPGAIGVKLATPDKTVIGFTGDGGSMYTIQALWTAAHHKIGAKFVICNNKSYQLLKLNLIQYWEERGIARHNFPASFELHSPEIRFDDLSRSMGVDAVRVERSDEIGPAIEKMLSTEGPFLIDLILSDINKNT